MKKCPNCHQMFSDDNSFCLNDGTTLQYASEASQTPTLFQTSDSAPTQFIPRPSVNTSNSSSGVPGWLYAVLGAMTAIIVALGITFFLTRAPAEKEIVKTEPGASRNENVSISNQSAVENKTIETMAENKAQNSRKETAAVLQDEISTKQIEAIS